MSGFKETRVLFLGFSLLAGCTSDEEKQVPPPTSFTLTVITQGVGSVNSEPVPLISGCTQGGGTCTATIPAGETITLRATEVGSSRFVAWAGGCGGSSALTCDVAMTSDREVTALFSLTAVGGTGDIYGITEDSNGESRVIFSIGSDEPGIIKSSIPVSGLQSGEQLVGLDFRPADGQLYGVAKEGTGSTGTGRLYRINKYARVAELVSTLSENLSGSEFAMDFDPGSDTLRIVGSSGQSLIVVPSSGAASSATVASGISGLAYDNNIAGATNRTLYAVNAASLLELTSSGSRTVGSLGATIGSVSGFDIDAVTNTAYLAYTTPAPMFATVTLETGAITGATPLPLETVRGLAVEIPPAPEVFGVNTVLNPDGSLKQYRLVRFGSVTPDQVTDVGVISGLDSGAGDRLVGIAFRPADGVLYALARGSTGAGDGGSQLYTIDTTSGAATAVGTRDNDPQLADALFGMDFDSADAIRVVNSAGQNLSVGRTTGATSKETDLVRPTIAATGVAFNNSQAAPTGGTTMYVIDAAEGRLGTVEGGVNDGRFTALGRLQGIALPLEVRGFEIIGVPDDNPDPAITRPNQVALVVLGLGGQDVLYTVDLANGAATLRGAINPSQGRVVAITAMPEDNPEGVTNQDIFAVTDSGKLLSFSRNTPGIVTRTCDLTTETILGAEIQPSSENLYVLTTDGTSKFLRSYDFTPLGSGSQTCPAAQELPSPAPQPTVTDTGPNGGFLAGVMEMDFDAATNTLHVTTQAGKHLTLDLVARVVMEREDLSDRVPFVGAVAYGGASPVLYDLNLDAAAVGPVPTLMTQDGAAGTLHDIGRFSLSRGIDNTMTPPTRAVASFDIFGPDDVIALAVLRARTQSNADEQFTRLYRVDLSTGNLTEVEGATCVGEGANQDCGGIGPRPAVIDPTDPTDPRETRLNITEIAIRFPAIP